MSDAATAEIITLRIITDPPDAEVMLNGTSLGRGPFPEPIYLNPWVCRVEFRATGRQTSVCIISRLLGSEQILSVRLQPVELEAHGPTMVPAFVLGGAAAISMFAGISLLTSGNTDWMAAEEGAKALRRNHKSCVPEAANFDKVRCAYVEDLTNSADAQHNAGVGLLVGAGAAMMGALLYVALAPELLVTRPLTLPAWRCAEPAVCVIPAISANSGGAVVRGSF